MPGKGRGMRATKAFEPGDLIIDEEPFGAVVMTDMLEGEPVCHSEFMMVDDKDLKTCVACKRVRCASGAALGETVTMFWVYQSVVKLWAMSTALHACMRACPSSLLAGKHPGEGGVVMFSSVERFASGIVQCYQNWHVTRETLV